MRRAVALVALLLATSAARGETACPSVGVEPVAIASVGSRLELHLVDGRTLRLVGLDPAGPTPNNPDLGETGRTALVAAVAGRTITASLFSDRPDRWGRLPATAFADGDPAPGGLALVAIDGGIGRYLPEPAAQPCRDALLAAEARARSASLGLWHDPYYGVLAVDDRDAFIERSATDIVVQGRLWRVDVGPFRTKLRFAAPGEAKHGLLVAVILPKVLKRFEGQGVHFEALIGRTLRLRGLLDLRFGPQIELAGPDAVELLPVATGASATAAAK